jgi:hypothetical protein
MSLQRSRTQIVALQATTRISRARQAPSDHLHRQLVPR